MKTMLRTLTILLVGVLVAGTLYLAVENTSLFSDAGEFPEGVTDFEERPEMPLSDMDERPELIEGGQDHHAASLTQGLTEVGTSLAKITAITIIVLLIQGLFAWLRKRWSTNPTLA